MAAKWLNNCWWGKMTDLLLMGQNNWFIIYGYKMTELLMWQMMDLLQIGEKWLNCWWGKMTGLLLMGVKWLIYYIWEQNDWIVDGAKWLIIYRWGAKWQIWLIIYRWGAKWQNGWWGKMTDLLLMWTKWLNSWWRLNDWFTIDGAK